jgi:hypothetical protein
MPDSITPPAEPSAATPATRGYDQNSQLEDLALGESIPAAALDEQDITALYLDGFDTVVKESRQRASESGQAKEDSKAATDLAGQAATDLVTALQQIQSSAKQKHKMLDEDGDPATNFPTDGYLIGTFFRQPPRTHPLPGNFFLPVRHQLVSLRIVNPGSRPHRSLITLPLRRLH